MKSERGRAPASLSLERDSALARGLELLSPWKTCTPQAMNFSASSSGTSSKTVSARDCSGRANSPTASIESRPIASATSRSVIASTRATNAGCFARRKNGSTSLRRVDLDRQLADGAEMLLGGDRHAEGRVGTERLPVLRRLPHVLVPQDHRDHLPVGRQADHALCLARLAEAVGNVGHGSWSSWDVVRDGGSIR